MDPPAKPFRAAVVVTGAASFVWGLLACDALKKNDADAAAPVATTTATAPATAATTAAPTVAPIVTSPPLGATPATPAGGAAGGAGGKPATATDAGKTDAAVATTDGGAAPAPTPTLTLPTALPGFDAGAFKPPAGFPSTLPTTLPTFPPAPKPTK